MAGESPEETHVFFIFLVFESIVSHSFSGNQQIKHRVLFDLLHGRLVGANGKIEAIAAENLVVNLQATVAGRTVLGDLSDVHTVVRIALRRLPEILVDAPGDREATVQMLNTIHNNQLLDQLELDLWRGGSDFDL